MNKKDNAQRRLGCHLSIAGGQHRAAERAAAAGMTAFQIFTANPRAWTAAPLAPEAVDRFRELTAAPEPWPVAHMPYLPNLAAPDRDLHARSIRVLIEELERCRRLGIEYLVAHLGSHLGTGEEEGRGRIVKALAAALEQAESTVSILIENTAGTRNSLGTTPADLARILDALDGPPRIGVCVDAAHAFAAGYDWRSEENPFFDEAERVGLAPRIRLLHLNDSKVELGRRADRHEHIGLGCIGASGLARFLGHRLFRGLPVILETPVDDRRGDRENLAAARDLG